MSKEGRRIIKMYEDEHGKMQGYWYPIYQDAADFAYPREDQLAVKGTIGEDKSVKVLDDTAIQDSQMMAAGLLSAWFPYGTRSLAVKVRNGQLDKIDRVWRWRMTASEILYDRVVNGSNFLMQFGESIRGAVVFGTACPFVEWNSARQSLNFRDYPIGKFLIKEDESGNVDTVMVSYHLTARQAVQKFGKDKCSAAIIADAEKLETESKKYGFIWLVRPRTELNPLLEDGKNMPWESVVVDKKTAEYVSESGFDELPLPVFRWMKGGNEKMGRGAATECLATIRMMQAVWKRFIQILNQEGDPSLLVNSELVENGVNMKPGGLTYVQDVDKAVRTVKQYAGGNASATESFVKLLQDMIHQRFYRQFFTQFMDLTGDRRTTTEIMFRKQEGLSLLGASTMRVEFEGLTKLMMRSLFLLIRNQQIPMPPPELLVVKGKNRIDINADMIGIEYTGPMAMALQNQQAQGFMQLAQAGAQLAPLYPGVMDLLNIETGFRQLGEKLGVNLNALASDEEVAQKRAQRQKEMARQQALQTADVAAKGYKAGTKAPEDGSAAQQVMEGANA